MRVASPAPDTRLAELLTEAARLQGHARQLVNRAGAACLIARQFAGVSQVYRDQRQVWATVLTQIPLDPEHVVILCMYCHRVRAARGWSVLPPGIEGQLRAWGGALVSHGICPDCLRRHLTPNRLTITTHSAA